MKIKPYTFLKLSDNESDNRFRIIRYNLTKRDWDILDGLYTDKMAMLSQIDKLNEEAGTITIILE